MRTARRGSGVRLVLSARTPHCVIFRGLSFSTGRVPCACWRLVCGRLGLPRCLGPLHKLPANLGSGWIPPFFTPPHPPAQTFRFPFALISPSYSARSLIHTVRWLCCLFRYVSLRVGSGLGSVSLGEGMGFCFLKSLSSFTQSTVFPILNGQHHVLLCLVSL